MRFPKLFSKKFRRTLAGLFPLKAERRPTQNFVATIQEVDEVCALIDRETGRFADVVAKFFSAMGGPVSSASVPSGVAQATRVGGGAYHVGSLVEVGRLMVERGDFKANVIA